MSLSNKTITSFSDNIHKKTMQLSDTVINLVEKFPNCKILPMIFYHYRLDICSTESEQCNRRWCNTDGSFQKKQTEK